MHGIIYEIQKQLHWLLGTWLQLYKILKKVELEMLKDTAFF